MAARAWAISGGTPGTPRNSREPVADSPGDSRALLVFEDKPLWFVLSRPAGTILILAVLYTFYGGIFKRAKERKTQSGGSPRTA